MPEYRKITCFLDCVSPYSRFALRHIQTQSAALASHGVEVEFIPMFLGGVNVGSGNKPAWTLPAKGNYGKYDLARAMKYYGLPNMKSPDCFPILSLLPQRAMCYIKHTYTQPTYLAIFDELWVGLWEQNMDISKPELLASVLSRHLTDNEAKVALEAAQSPHWKAVLNRNTQEALDKGAYGSPWFWVRNGEGVEEPFFGSDRFHYMWTFLGLPQADFTLLSDAREGARL